MDTNLSNNLLKPAHMDEKRAFPRDVVTPSQKRALVALLEARSIAAAARKARVGDSTLRRWLREDEAFQTKLRQLRGKLSPTPR